MIYFFIVALLLILLRYIFIFHLNIKLKSYLKKFTYLKDIDLYKESKPLIYINKENTSMSVLLIHGFSASPYEFIHIIKDLEKAGISYYAPVLTGFGNKSLRNLSHVHKEDWLRDCSSAYELLSNIFDKVNVIGVSNGALLASYISQHFPVHKLIWIGPNFVTGNNDLLARKLILHPLSYNLIKLLIPLFPKPIRKDRVSCCDTLDPIASFESFHYHVVTVQGLHEIWQLQDSIQFNKIQYNQLHILIGEQDQTINASKLIQLVEENSLKYKMITYPKTAHNVLQDYERKNASSDIVNILKKERW